MLEELKRKVYKANMMLPAYSLVTLTWGNVSGIDRDSGLMVIKPSGVSYDDMREEDMVVTDLDGHVVEGDYRPSSDTLTHIELYKAFPGIGGIVHTHSAYAVSWAQAGRDIPCYGTTHADQFYGSIPCVPQLSDDELEEAYERYTGIHIAAAFADRGIDPEAVPACLCTSHGPFSWGRDPEDAVHSAVIMEECAKMAFMTELIVLTGGKESAPVKQSLMDKHYYRKHGANAYYGQVKKK